MKKAFVLAGMVALSMAGLRGDLKKAGHWISEHHTAIETGAEDALKVGEIVADASFVNVQGLIKDGIQTVSDITAKKGVGDYIIDGLKIIGDLTQKTGSTSTSDSAASNTEELFNFGTLVTDAGDVAKIAEDGAEVANVIGDLSFVNVQGLIKDGIQTVSDITAKKGLGDYIEDGLKIIGDLTQKSGSASTATNTEELFNLGNLVTDAGDVVKIAEDGAEVANVIGDLSFVNVQGLIKDGIQTVSDITAKKGLGDYIEDGLKIIGDLTQKSGSTATNTEELFSLSDALHDAGDVAGVVSAGVEVAGLFA